MPIARLREVAAQRLPLTVSDDDQVAELRVLMAAGLIAGLRLVNATGPEGTRSAVIRVLAITPAGRRLLHRAPSDAPTSAHG